MTLTWVAVSVLVAAVLAAAAVRFARVRRQRDETRALKTEVRKWEDEGGNVPQVPTVSPVVTPATSVPLER